MTPTYWKQKAAPWVTFAVLTGGLVSAVLLFWIVKIENSARNFLLESPANSSLFSQQE